MSVLQITGHNVEITPTINDFIHKKFERVEKHIEKITNIHVFLDINKLSQKAEATIHVPGHEFFASSESDDMYKNIDMLVDKIIRQMEKYKGKHNQ